MIQKGEWNKKSKKLACVKGPDSKGNESQSKERENFKKAYETELWYDFENAQVNSTQNQEWMQKY